MNKALTLREYLDQNHIDSNDDSDFVIVHGNVQMNVCRRYLESTPMQKYLDMIIVDFVYPYTTIYGVDTIKIFLADKTLLEAMGLSYLLN